MVFEQGDLDNKFVFSGRFGVQEDEHGLHYMRARYYDSESGRFISPDPIRLAGQDFNLYRYVGINRPKASIPTGFGFGTIWMMRSILRHIHNGHWISRSCKQCQ